MSVVVVEALGQLFMPQTPVFRNLGKTKTPDFPTNAPPRPVRTTASSIPTPPSKLARSRRILLNQSRDQPVNEKRKSMVSLRSLLGPSTALLRQFLPRHSSNLRVLARPFSQLHLSKLTVGNGLRLLRSPVTGGYGAVSSVFAARQVEQVRGMKTRSAVKRLCDGCKVCWLSVDYINKGRSLKRRVGRVG